MSHGGVDFLGGLVVGVSREGIGNAVAFVGDVANGECELGKKVQPADLAWCDVLLSEDREDDGVVSAVGEVLPVEVGAPDFEGVDHGEEFLLVGGVVHLRGKDLLACEGDGVFVGWSLGDGEDLAKVLKVGLEGGTINEDVIEVYDETNIEEVVEDVVHGGLEYGGGISESERHHEELVVPEPRVECGLVGVLLADANLVEATVKVDLGKTLGSTEAVKKLGDPRYYPGNLEDVPNTGNAPTIMRIADLRCGVHSRDPPTGYPTAHCKGEINLALCELLSTRQDTHKGTSTSPYTAEQDAKAAAILKERREKKEAKKKALIEEQAAKLKKIEEEMVREKKRLRKEAAEKLKAVEEEEEVEEPPLERRRTGGRGESSGTNEDQMAKKITDWVAGLSLGEEEEALIRNPLKRQAIEDEKRMEWKFRLTREKERRMEAASQAAKELEEVKKQRAQMAKQVDLLGKMEIMVRNIERLAPVQEEQYQFGRGQDIALRSIRLGLRDFARELATQVGSEVNVWDRGKWWRDKKEETLDSWLRTVPVWVRAKRTLVEEEVISVASYLEGLVARWLNGLVASKEFGRNMGDSAKTYTLESFMDLVEARWHNLQQAQIAIDGLLKLDARKYKSVRELTTTVERLIVVPGNQTEIDDISDLVEISELDDEDSVEGSNLAVVVKTKAGGRG
ncbi:hypothetical protein CBR_g4296 [Chara braunii]|uniref:Uncharacterized protein n=1 Tax=Chara braunii TaxID=69332 RepID=A0A388JRD0_CHABU|nr:hypothetical protein CBR_g4296 [Chara braunii]|eukprot:GBG60340.1 hypothetical protein CBR_g4296 [Chara braunii]